MKHDLLKRLAAFGLAAVTTTALAAPGMAASITYAVPTTPMTVDENLILVAAHAQADVTPEIIGLTNTTDRTSEVPADYSLTKAQTSALIGTFGTDINEYPNPYLYNWAYNSYASENDMPLTDKHTLGGISGSPNSMDVEVSEEWGGTSRSLYYRPDILIGTGSFGGASGDYASLIADLPENKDEDPSNDYDPYIVEYLSSRSYDFLDTLYELANISNQITAETGKTGRYGDPMVIANDLTKYTKGLQSYILSRLDADGAKQKVVAIVDPINSADGVFYAVNENTSVQGTTTNSRAGEFLADTTVNIVEVLGKTSETGTVGASQNKTYYILTAEEIVQADVIIISGIQNQDGSEGAFRELLLQYIDPSKTDLVDRAENLPIMATRFSCVGSIGANSIENLLGMAYWSAFCYPEYVNPVYVATYWYENFYHISDNSSLQTAIATNFASASIPEGYGYTTDISGYSAEEIEAMIIEGLHYYESHEAELSDLLLANYGNNGAEKWSVDWSTGIGASESSSSNTFTDILPDEYYYDAVNWAIANKVTSGTTATTFSPAADCTRAQIVTFLWRAMGEPKPTSANNPFTDVPAGEYYTDAVLWAVENGITSGTTTTTFSPNDPCTRAQIVTFLWRSKGMPKPASSNNPFTDVPAGEYYTDAVLWAVANGITSGTTTTTFSPNTTCTRGQGVTFLFQAT